jgi:hypothetical protein
MVPSPPIARRHVLPRSREQTLHRPGASGRAMTMETMNATVTPAPERNLDSSRDAAPSHSRWGPLGAVPIIFATSASGLLLVTLADALSRSGRSHGEALFWTGLLVIFVPFVLRLASSEARRSERIVLLLLLGAAFYLVKVLRDPFGFTYADELVHQYNALQIVRTHGLFGANPILAVTSSYPGLESLAGALASTTGLSTFVAGLIIIGLARLIFTLALYLLYEAITQSPLVAGLAAALYAASPHYLFFTAQFSYESLALPLLVMAAFAVVRARPPTGPMRFGWAVVALGAISGVVVTHHMTSYGLVAVLAAICLVPLPWRTVRARRPWVFAAAAIVATGGWLMLVAAQTVGYLSPVLEAAVRATFQTAAGESPSRQLFHGGGGQTAPAWEHLAGIGSVLIILAALPLGFIVLWRRHRDDPFAVVLGLAAAAYVGTLPLRLVPAAWETAVRASEFLFVGVALLLGMAAARLCLSMSPLVRLATCALAGVLLVGSVVSGSSQGRLAQPYRVAAGGADVQPAGVAVARWARRVLGPGQRVAAEEADARLLLVYGEQHVFAGTNPPITSVLQTPVLYRWQLDVLRRNRIRYVVVDARRASADVSTGYYFSRRPAGAGDRFPRAALTKFERAGARRIYDSGEIIVDDVAGVRYAAATP